MAIYKYQKGANGRLHFGFCARRYSYLDKGKIERGMNQNNLSTDQRQSSTNTTAGASDETPTGTYRFYHDENLVSFFRRLSFSPDGSFLITPAGLHKNTNEYNMGPNDDEMQNCSYIFPRNTILK